MRVPTPQESASTLFAVIAPDCRFNHPSMASVLIAITKHIEADRHAVRLEYAHQSSPLLPWREAYPVEMIDAIGNDQCKATTPTLSRPDQRPDHISDNLTTADHAEPMG